MLKVHLSSALQALVYGHFKPYNITTSYWVATRFSKFLPGSSKKYTFLGLFIVNSKTEFINIKTLKKYSKAAFKFS